MGMLRRRLLSPSRISRIRGLCVQHRWPSTRLQTSGAAATAETAVVALNYHMAQLAGKAVVAVDQLTIDHHAGANTGAECDHDEILETAGSAIGHLTDSGGIGVVGDSYGKC